ncbi:Uncharacterized protein Adt_09643 [Abeliophyllum distichum]|uniref:Uncharacterized protein n=1 Tax=Abeliophyllum distichum TaxID=126358 RepID=A0ABD1UHR4_9LAMI
MIIPGKDFEEMKLIDDSLVQSLKDFRKFVIKDQEAHMVLRINSIIPFWDENIILIKGYHHIQIKTVPEIILDEPIAGETTCVNHLILNDWRALSFQKILTGLKTFNKDSKIKINHFSKFILMTSRTGSIISPENVKILCNFEKNFYNLPNTPPNYQGQLCNALISSIGKYHACQWCEGNRSDSIAEKENRSDSTMEKEESTLDKSDKPTDKEGAAVSSFSSVISISIPGNDFS